MARFSEWINPSKLPFFLEYTDHGSEHIGDVLLTASELIPSQSLKLLTASDIGVRPSQTQWPVWL